MKCSKHTYFCRDSSREFIDPWAPNSGPAGGAYASGGASSLSQARSGSSSADGGYGSLPGEEKNSTQVTIPKDVSEENDLHLALGFIHKLNFLFSTHSARRCNHWQSWQSHPTHSNGIECFHNYRRTSAGIFRSNYYDYGITEANSNGTVSAATKVIFSFYRQVINEKRNVNCVGAHWLMVCFAWKTSDFVVLV